MAKSPTRMFTDIVGELVCLVYGANLAVIKEFNLRQHCETKHRELRNLNAEQKIQKVEELKKTDVSHSRLPRESFCRAA